MTIYIVSQYGPGNQHDTQDMAYVEADSEQEAARVGAIYIQRHIDITNDDVQVENVFVHPVDGWTVYNIVPAAELAEMQCCGGNGFTEDGHSGYCINKRKDHTGSSGVLS